MAFYLFESLIAAFLCVFPLFDWEDEEVKLTHVVFAEKKWGCRLYQVGGLKLVSLE